jgi:hyperosmotically inducible protein
MASQSAHPLLANSKGLASFSPKTERNTMRLRNISVAVLFVSVAFGQGNRSLDRERETITKEVRHELVMLPRVNVFDNITYRVDGSTVILSGQVAQPMVKSDAENALKGIEGVQRVDNQIEVLPLSPIDDRLRLALYRAIYGFNALNRYALPVVKPIRIIVKNGRITLEGVVDNDADKNIAGIRANGVHGVFSVTNNLRVEK